MNHLKNILTGAGQVLVLDSGVDYVRPTRNDFARDIKALKSDSKRFVSSFARVTKEHGKQVYNSKG